jgi:hypothetical protein
VDEDALVLGHARVGLGGAGDGGYKVFGEHVEGRRCDVLGELDEQAGRTSCSLAAGIFWSRPVVERPVLRYR